LRKIGVIQLIDSLHAGGAEVLAVNIANGLFEQGVNSHICATRSEGVLKENIHNNVGYVFLNRKDIIDFKAVLHLNKYLKKHQINLIHAHATSYFFAVCVKVINPNIKIIWHNHFGDNEFLSKRALFPLKGVSYFFSLILSVNNNLRKWSTQNLKTKNVLFIRNFAFFNNQEKSTILKGNDGKRIVHLAGYRKQKDHLNLLKGFLEISKENNDWTLHLVGKSYDDTYSKFIDNFIEHHNLSERVFQYGVCSDIKYVLSQSDIGVLSSYSEGLPLALLEYGLAKLAVVVTNVGECNNVIIHNTTGLIVEKRNDTALSEAIRSLVISKEKRIKFGEENFNYVSKHFSKEQFINKLKAIYSEIV
jgi:glycosyltransferase involved in cell wall biosynthesis